MINVFIKQTRHELKEHVTLALKTKTSTQLNQELKNFTSYLTNVEAEEAATGNTKQLEITKKNLRYIILLIEKLIIKNQQSQKLTDIDKLIKEQNEELIRTNKNWRDAVIQKNEIINQWDNYIATLKTNVVTIKNKIRKLKSEQLELKSQTKLPTQINVDTNVYPASSPEQTYNPFEKEYDETVDAEANPLITLLNSKV